MQEAKDLQGAFAAAQDVTIAWLPFGGAVLVNGRTLALLECAEPDAMLLDALVSAPRRRHRWNAPLDAVLERTARRLVDDEWLVPATQRRG